MSSEMTDGERAPRSGREMALELQKPRAVNGEPKFRDLEPHCQLVATFHGAARCGLTLRGKTPQATPCHGASPEAHALTHAISSAVNDP